ncbi:hypothetical protein ACIQF6_19455 [Kitasatospora sp. NPDC092948]|uniref:hypothetical protein n=1 Tax=Kitasatospora sp. NPDC092948 TaxID=3364088 RepID=UPI00381DA6D7
MRILDTFSRSTPAGATIALLTPVALLGLGVATANSDYTTAGGIAALTVLAAALLALFLLRPGGRPIAVAALMGFALVALPGAVLATQIRHFRGEHTELVLTAGRNGSGDPACVLRRTDGKPLAHAVVRGCTPPAEPGQPELGLPELYLVDPAGWVDPVAAADDDLKDTAYIAPFALAAIVWLWIRTVLGATRRTGRPATPAGPDPDAAPDPGATDHVPGA